MAIRKLKLIWQQVHDSTSYLYQPWSFLNIDKPRKQTANNINSSITTNDLRNVFTSSTMPIISNVQSSSSIIHTEQLSLNNPQTISKPSVYQTPMDTSANMFIQPPSLPTVTQTTSLPFSPRDLLPKTPQIHVEPIVQPIIEENEQQRKRPKIVDTRPVEIVDDDDEDEDGAERKILFFFFIKFYYFLFS